MSPRNSKPYENDMEIHQKISMPDDQKLKTIVKRSIVRNSDCERKAPEMRQLKQEQWLRIAGVIVVLNEDKESAISGKQKDSVREETSVVSGTMKIIVQKPTPKTAAPSEPPAQRGRSASRKKNLRGRSPSGKFARQPCRDYLKGICTIS